MQGKKHHQERLFTQFKLSEHVPESNFYRRLNSALDLNFLYKETNKYYGKCGQLSIDPVVFFKIGLIGYLENIPSDRKLIEFCSMRLDILYFIGYNIDEPLPWHSTISRTRQLLPEEVFDHLFDKVLTLCISKNMVAGHTQVIDSAFVKANASMDSLELKVPAQELDAYLEKVRVMSKADRPAKQDKSAIKERIITADKRKLKEIETRNKRWADQQDQRPGAGNKGSKYTSNKTHYSPVDPDSRISVKPGKARKLNYLAQMSVDSSHHVITHIHADYADKKDNQCLQALVDTLKTRLDKHGVHINELLADAGYSSGENYAYLEKENIISYIPPHGTYKGGPEGFEYHREGNFWLCPQGKKVTFRKQKIEKGTLKDYYYTKRSDCKGCPIKDRCIGKQYEKRISITAYKAEYDRAIARLSSPEGRHHKAKRMSTVEPVFGTLINFMSMQKVFTKGIKQAHKQMLMSAIAYNLKKWLNYKVNYRNAMSIRFRIAQKQVKKGLFLLNNGFLFIRNSMARDITNIFQYA